jgi:uncharacterized paraquat-inducible protein A
MNKNHSERIYSAREVIEILEKAKELGVISITLPGFEATWHPQSDALQQEAVETHCELPQDFREEATGECPRCNSELTVGRWGPYCHPCFLKRKEKNFQRLQRG